MVRTWWNVRLGSVLALLSLCLSAVAQKGEAPRMVINLDRGWLFHAGEVRDGASPSLNDSQWRTLRLPHDFQIEQPWVAPSSGERADTTDVAANVKSLLSGRGFKAMGRGWYRYHFTPSESMRGQRVLLDFEGIIYTGDVYLNGKHIGGTDYGYVGFEIDITDRLLWEQDNVVAVMADTRSPENSRWYTGGGLFRPVHLIVTASDLFFERHPLHITTRDNRFVRISAAFTDRHRNPATQMAVRITGPDGRLVYADTLAVGRHPMARTREWAFPEIEIAQPQLWDTGTPNLYCAEVMLLRPDGTVADMASSRFGIRTIDIGPDYGLRLNGRKILLRGIANHHSLGALGAAAYPRAIEKRLRLLKSFGVNHIRTSHNPYSRRFIELCDSLGLLVVDELYDKWTRQHTGGRVAWEQLWQYDVAEWVRRDRNSPSVVMWSLGNETQQSASMPYGDWGVTAYRLQKTLLHRYDSTRCVTVAMHPRYRNWTTDSLPCDLAMETDVQAYNYRYMYFPGDGRRFPWMTFYQSEASTSNMGPNFFEMDLGRVIGLAYWGAIDYLGESQGWPAKGWTQGVFDIALEPKPKAYLMKSLFTDEPVVHIGIIESHGNQMWNGVQTGNDIMSDHWNHSSGDTLSVVAYTNADAVELKVNGRSLGVKRNPKDDPKGRNQVRWKGVVYQPGTIEAFAYRDGTMKAIATHRIETAGEAVRLVAVADNDHWCADGTDLQHVRIVAVDRKGRRVPHAADALQFSVEGDAAIVAVSNGDMTSDEPNVADHRQLYHGSALVILRSGTTASRIRLHARNMTGTLSTHLDMQTLNTK